MTASAALLIGVAAAVMVGCAGGTPAGDPRGQTAAAVVGPMSLGPVCPTTGSDPDHLDIVGFAYCPATRNVAVGAEVVWTNADLAPHTVTYDGPDGPVDSGSMAQGQSWSTRFAHAGTYRYYCRFHPGMEATITVAPGS